jgi:hypothetical protein
MSFNHCAGCPPGLAWSVLLALTTPSSDRCSVNVEMDAQQRGDPTSTPPQESLSKGQGRCEQYDRKSGKENKSVRAQKLLRKQAVG